MLWQYITYSFLLLDIMFKQVEGTLHFSSSYFFFLKIRHRDRNPYRRRSRRQLEADSTQTLRENFFVPSVMSDWRCQVSAVCLVCGSRRATSPAVRSRNDTSSIGTAQLVSTSFPKMMFPVIAATRPTPVKKPRAEDLQDGRKKCYNSVS